jgi:alanine racemase
MTLRSEIIGVQTLKAGDTVGYGSRYRAKGEQRIGIVAAAMPTATRASRRAARRCWVDGVRTGTVGTVSMDMLAVDLTPCPQAGSVRRSSCGATRLKLMTWRPRRARSGMN